MTELHHFHPARKGSCSLCPFPIYPLYTRTVILSLDKPIADCFLFRPRKSREKRRKRSHTNVSSTLSTRSSTPPAQTAHVRFKGMQRVHTRLCSKNRTQRLTRRNRGLPSLVHSVVLCCRRNCHRKNSRRKWMHALRRVSAFSGAAAPLGCATLFSVCLCCIFHARRTGISACAKWRRYHHPRRTPHIVETPGARLSK